MSGSTTLSSIGRRCAAAVAGSGSGTPPLAVPAGFLRQTPVARMLWEPGYRSRSGRTLVDFGRDRCGEEVGLDPALGDWEAVRGGRRGIGVRQPAGPENPLGRFRFHMDNDQAIYLHDTNEPDLFAKARRAISSGCVRVSDPFALAAFVAEGADARWRGWAADPEWATRWLDRKSTRLNSSH